MQIQRGAVPVEHIKISKNTPLELYFSKSKFAHTQPLFKENNALYIYQLNIFNSKRFL